MAMWIFSEGRHVFSFIALRPFCQRLCYRKKRTHVLPTAILPRFPHVSCRCDYATLPENCPEKTDWNHQPLIPKLFLLALF